MSASDLDVLARSCRLLKKQKAELASDMFFGNSAILSLQDPLLSVPASRRVWLYRGYLLIITIAKA
jgi:hypothetical protein